jgi:hypothetical protein
MDFLVDGGRRHVSKNKPLFIQVVQFYESSKHGHNMVKITCVLVADFLLISIDGHLLKVN